MGSTGTPTNSPYRRIGNTELEGCVWKGLVWVRGPCGGEHAMSFQTAGQLRDWLDDLYHVVLDQAVETARDERKEIGFG